MESLKQREIRIEEHYPSGISFSQSDPAELLVAHSSNQGNNWIPSQEIQLSGNLRDDSCINDATRLLVNSGRYRDRKEGRGAGNIVLTPNEINNIVNQAIKLVGGLPPLLPLIGLLREFFPFILSITLLPNTSVGLKERGVFATKLNGIIVEVNDLKDNRVKRNLPFLLEKIRLPLGRGLSVFGLRGIGIEDFILNFSDGEEIIGQPLSSTIKFADFFYGEEGEVYLIVGGGGLDKKI